MESQFHHCLLVCWLFTCFEGVLFSFGGVEGLSSFKVSQERLRKESCDGASLHFLRLLFLETFAFSLGSQFCFSPDFSSRFLSLPYIGFSVNIQVFEFSI